MNIAKLPRPSFGTDEEGLVRHSFGADEDGVFRLYENWRKHESLKREESRPGSSFFYRSRLEASLSRRGLFKFLSLPLSQQIS
nr:hypothetical protein CFP56_27550 [Quercus suber]